MHFRDFVRDQFAEVEKIYEALVLPMTARGAERMRAYIADHPKGKDGIHGTEVIPMCCPDISRDTARDLAGFCRD